MNFEDTAAHFRSNNIRETLEELKASEVKDPENPEILYNLAIAYAKLSLHHTADEYFSKLIEKHPDYAEIIRIYRAHAYTLINLEKYKEAQKNINKVLSFNPHDISALNMKAYVFEKTGAIEKAEDLYREILKLQKNNSTAMNALAWNIYSNNKNLEEAHDLSLTALKYQPDNPAYLDTMACVKIKMGKLKEAEKLLIKAKRLRPADTDIINHFEMLEKLKNNQP